jgi:hypothetical protein
MSDVFLSYASEDRGRVAAIVSALEASGLSVWWDRAIQVGASYDDAIEVALNAARCVVTVWTERLLGRIGTPLKSSFTPPTFHGSHDSV